MQSVNVGASDQVAFDWTCQTIKNCNLPGAKAGFTGIKGSTKEIVALAIVPMTTVSDISHLLQQSIQSASNSLLVICTVIHAQAMTPFGKQYLESV